MSKRIREMERAIDEKHVLIRREVQHVLRGTWHEERDDCIGYGRWHGKCVCKLCERLKSDLVATCSSFSGVWMGGYMIREKVTRRGHENMWNRESNYWRSVGAKRRRVLGAMVTLREVTGNCAFGNEKMSPGVNKVKAREGRPLKRCRKKPDWQKWRVMLRKLDREEREGFSQEVNKVGIHWLSSLPVLYRLFCLWVAIWGRKGCDKEGNGNSPDRERTGWGIKEINSMPSTRYLDWNHLWHTATAWKRAGKIGQTS